MKRPSYCWIRGDPVIRLQLHATPPPFTSRLIIFWDLRLAPWTMHAYQDNKIDGQMPFTCEAFNGFFMIKFQSLYFFFLPGTIFFLGCFPDFVIAALRFFFGRGRGGGILPIGQQNHALHPARAMHITVGPHSVFGLALHYLEYSYGI